MDENKKTPYTDDYRKRYDEKFSFKKLNDPFGKVEEGISMKVPVLKNLLLE